MKAATLQEGRIDEWRILELVGQTELPCNQHDLGKRQSIEKRDTMCRKLDVMLGKDHGFVDRQQPKDQPEVKGDHQAFLHLVISSVLEGLTSQVTFSTSSPVIENPKRLFLASATASMAMASDALFARDVHLTFLK